MDYARLRLKYRGDSARLDEILQAECREKCARKLPRLSACPGFRFPSTALAEMSTSEEVARVHASLMDGGGEKVLDMTFGLGVDAFAFASRGCEVTAVELDPAAYEAGVDNIRLLMPGGIELIQGDSVSWLKESGRNFDTIFIDPQRRDGSGRHFSLSQCKPDLTLSLPLLLERSRKVIVKMSPMADVKGVKRELGIDRCRIIIIGTAKECKELVMEISSAASLPNDTIECVTVGHDHFSFCPGVNEEPLTIADPVPGMWLLEPYPAVMKAAPLGSMRHIPFPKVAVNTHLFLSSGTPEGFPGERMMIREVLPFGKQAVRDLRLTHPLINVAVRNFPLSAAELVKKLKVREGGEEMLHGITLADGRKVLLVTDMPQ